MDKRIRILIDDGNQISLGTGIGKYSLYLYKALKNIGYDVDLVEQNNSTSSRYMDRMRYLFYINSKKYMKQLERYDIVLYTNYTMPFRKNKKTRYAVSIPDMVAFLYPETLPILYRYYNQLMINNSVKKADLIFTISSSVEKEITQKYPNCKHKIHTTWLGIYEGINPLPQYEEYNNPQLKDIDLYDYFLFISTVEKRKNVGLVLKAFINLKQTEKNAEKYKLVIVGRPGYGYDSFVRIANESGFEKDIVFAGYTNDKDCNRLYNHAKAFVFPTIYEGFGFAQIECMKCHLPIILSDIPTNKEISRDYGEFFELDKPNTLVEKMRLFVNNEYDYETKNEIADRYIDDFDWEKIAEQYGSTLR